MSPSSRSFFFSGRRLAAPSTPQARAWKARAWECNRDPWSEAHEGQDSPAIEPWWVAR